MTNKDKELAAIRRYSDNLLAVYRRSSPQERVEGKAWYDVARSACREISQRHGFPLKNVCFAMAALSNNVQWETNVDICNDVAFQVRQGLELKGHFTDCLEKAAACLNGNLEALSGPKVIPFAQAIYHKHSQAAVVDRWIWRACGGFAESKWLTAARLRRVQAALRRVARKVRRPVSDLQAIVWLTIQNDANNPVPF